MANTIEYPPLLGATASYLGQKPASLIHPKITVILRGSNSPKKGIQNSGGRVAGARLAKLWLARFDSNCQQPGASAILRLPTIVLSVLVDIFVHLDQHVYVYKEAMITRFSSPTFVVFAHNKTFLPRIVFGKISFHCTRIPIIWVFIARLE